MWRGVLQCRQGLERDIRKRSQKSERRSRGSSQDNLKPRRRLQASGRKMEIAVPRWMASETTAQQGSAKRLIERSDSGRQVPRISEGGHRQRLPRSQQAQMSWWPRQPRYRSGKSMRMGEIPTIKMTTRHQRQPPSVIPTMPNHLPITTPYRPQRTISISERHPRHPVPRLLLSSPALLRPPKSLAP